MVGEKSGMQAGGVGECIIPLQRAQAERGAFVVYCVVEHLFGGIRWTSTRRGRGSGCCVRRGNQAKNDDRREREAHENVENVMAEVAAHNTD